MLCKHYLQILNLFNLLKRWNLQYTPAIHWINGIFLVILIYQKI